MPSYLRRFDRRRHYRDGNISDEVFTCRDGEGELSYTFFEEGLSVSEFQRDKALDSGDLPGIIKINSDQFASLKLESPTLAVDARDPKYGHLHHITPCLDAMKAELIAKILSESNSVLVDFKKRKH